MTQDEIMEMARQAHFDSKTWVDIFADNPTVGDVRNYLIAFAKLVKEKAAAKEREYLIAFAKLVKEKAAAKEREACAKVCENRPLGTAYDNGTACAAAIRARGEQA